MNDKYILNKDGEPLLEPDLMTWGKAFEKASDRIVKQEHIGLAMHQAMVERVTALLALDEEH